MEVKEIKGKLV